MKIGDLVRLSAYGRQKKRANWIDREDVGLIIKIIKYDAQNNWPDDFVVRWIKSEYNRRNPWGSERSNTRKDLKYAK
tara:strand:+ start:106 stop:336 length:231 start_codon:yes stop_codon:yes gene_type:complete